MKLTEQRAKQLLVDFQAGNSEAWAELQTLLGKLSNFVSRRYSLKSMEQEDLQQELTIAGWRVLKTLETIDYTKSTLESFMLLVMKRKAINLVKRELFSNVAKVNNGTSLDDKVGKDSTVGSFLCAPEKDKSDCQELRELLPKLVASLSKLERDCVELYLQSYTYDEIGARLGVSGKVVDNSLLRAKEKARALLKRVNVKS